MIDLRQVADVDFPSRWANFRLLGFQGWNEHRPQQSQRTEIALALVLGEIDKVPPIVRIHSQCTTGDVFHSLRCDCRDQLHLALRTIADNGAGVLLYEFQEGRGIGLLEKLRAYELQDCGFDTIEANLQLGHPVDLRDYRLAVAILQFLNIRSVRLMTNNPDKIAALSTAGIQVVERLSADVPHNIHSEAYLATKRDRLGHVSTANIAVSRQFSVASGLEEKMTLD